MKYEDSIYAKKPWTQHYAPSMPKEIKGLPFENLGQIFSYACAHYRSQKAFSMCLPNGFHASLTYGKIEELSNRLAYYLRHVLKLEKGDRVACQMPNCLSYCIAIMGILKAGLVIVNVNPLYTENEMEHVFVNSEARAVVILDMFAHKLEKIISKTKIEHVLFAQVGDFFPTALKKIVHFKLRFIDKIMPKIKLEGAFLAQVLKHPLPAARQHTWQPWQEKNNIKKEDLACLQYTGGTTGVSKGAELSHGHLMAGLEQAFIFVSTKVIRGQEVVLAPLPLYHVFSFMANFLIFFYVGAHTLLIPNPRPITHLKKVFAKFPVTWMTGVNTLYHALTQEPWFIKSPPRHLKMAVAGGMPLFEATAKAFSQLVPGALIIEGYGLTETSSVLCFNPVAGKIKYETVGIPLSSTEVKLVDDNDIPVPLGEPGEFVVRGPQIIKRYWKDPRESAMAIRNGWLYTGDIAVMDEDGFFKIVDRKKDMILVSGFNVYPNEIEDCLLKNEAIAECAAVGVKDHTLGEVVQVFIVLKAHATLTEEQVKEHCKQYLTAYKVPKRIVFRSELPKTPVGKILRRELRQA